MVNELTQAQKENLYTSTVFNPNRDLSSLKKELDRTTYEELKFLKEYIIDHPEILHKQGSSMYDDCQGGDEEEIANNTFQNSYGLMTLCAKNGMLSLFKFLIKYGGYSYNYSLSITHNLSQVNGYGAGPLEAFKYGIKNKYVNLHYACSYALSSNSLDVVKYIHEKTKNTNDSFKNQGLYYLLRCKNPEIYKFYKNIVYGGQKIPCGRHEYKQIVEKGNYAIVKMFHDDGARGTVGTLNAAILGGNIQIVKLLHEEEGINLNKTSVKNAALSGNYDVIKYLINENKNFNDVMDLVLLHCDFETLKFMHKRDNFTINKKTIERIITNVLERKDHIECLQYVYKLSNDEQKKYFNTLSVATLLHNHSALKIESLMALVDKVVEDRK